MMDPKNAELRLSAADVADLPEVDVGPGCTRVDLPGTDGVRIWYLRMEAGSSWPYVDHHTDDEFVYVVDGDVVDGGVAYTAGSYFRLLAGSSHRPSTVNGVTMVGMNVASASGRSRPR